MESRHTSLSAALRQTVSFVSFVARTFRSFYAIIALTLVVLVLEYAATSLMIPFSSGATGANGVVARFWQDVIDSLGMEAEARTWLWLFFVVMTARLVLGYVQVVWTSWLGKKVHRALSGRIFSHVVSSESLTSVYTRSVGHYVTLAGDDTSRCGNIISSLLQCAVTLSSALVAIVVLYQFSGALFAAIAAFLAICAVAIGVLFRRMLKLNARSNLLSRELNTNFIEALNSLRSIRALCAETFVSQNYAQQLSRYVRMLFKIDAARAGVKAFPAILLLVIAAILMRQDSSLVVTETSLLAVTIITVRIFAAMGQFIGAGTLLLTDMRAVHDIDSLIKSSASVSAAPDAATVDVETVTLKGVDFGFGTRTRILTNFSYHFEKNKTYAIVGASGSGKSTLADVILGLVRPERGTVAINGGRTTHHAVRAKMMLVEQQPKIFSSTLRENLLFGWKAPDERLWEALRLVDLEHTVRHMRDGLDTMISYQGENFSGGQRQRIGIARALVRDPDLLILDEATSALDTRTRKVVLANVRERMKSGLLLMITHDSNLSDLADIVLDFEHLHTAAPTDIVQSA